jgi:uroporphyrin-3 C-methyltransferase
VASHARSLGIQEAIVGGPGDDELHAQLMAYFAPRMSDAPPQRKSKAPLLLAVAIVLAAALAAAFWLDARNRIDATQQELARRLRDIENDAREARSVARQSQEALREAQAKVGQLEARLAESQSQQLALEALYQDLSRNRDEWQLAEIEQVLAIASQQLQLAGNVRAALLALQLAEARLARADRPQFLPIRRALARDIERLKSLPALDLAGMSMRLDSLVAQVDSLPLAFDERGERIGAPKEAAPAAGERGFWSRLGAEVWSELRQLVVVRQVNDPEPPLLPPSQAYFLRENLRLRLLNARLTLLTRDEAGYREDLRVAQAWIQRYFDPQSRQAREMLAQLKQLSSTTLSFEMPTISESLDAVRGFKSRKERTP